jgi:hypothetical protein
MAFGRRPPDQASYTRLDSSPKTLCQVHSDEGMVRHDGLLLLCLHSSDSGTSMPTKSQEESIPSDEAVRT